MEKQRKNTINHRKILTAAIAEAIILTTLAGCADKKVDYGTDTENLTKSTVCNVKDFSTETVFNDEFSVQTDNAYVKVKIAADVELPDCDTMSVMEVERIPCTAEYKEKVLKAYYGEAQIYYYDAAHRTKAELQNMIDFFNEHDGYDDGVSNARKLISEYTALLETAKDEWTPITEYDSSNEYVGKKGDTWYEVIFEESNGENEKLVESISATAIGTYKKPIASDEYEYTRIYDDGYVQQYYGPPSLKGYDTVWWKNDSGAIGKQPLEQDNESGITIDEAKESVESFMKNIGLDSMIETAESDCDWEGYNRTADNVYLNEDIHDSIWGYNLSYDIGMDGIIFCDSIDISNYSTFYSKYVESENDSFPNESSNLSVNEYGISDFNINYPVIILRKQQNVELLPVENIFSIAGAELKDNIQEYMTESAVEYDTLRLGYTKVKDSKDQNKFSYIPAWSLQKYQSATMGFYPVFINAIDGSVIHPDDLS